jgi:hypothetical protein
MQAKYIKNGARRIVSERQMMRMLKHGDQIGSAGLREDASQANKQKGR